MAHLTDRLVTEDDLKEILGISDAVDDNRLTLAADAATQMVQAYCDRHFVQQATATPRVFVASTPWVLEVDDISTTTGLIVKTDEDDDGVFENPGDPVTGMAFRLWAGGRADHCTLGMGEP
jgi:hypothetical protein